jgi:hypothetical protein
LRKLFNVVILSAAKNPCICLCVACSFACHSAAKRRNLLLLLPHCHSERSEESRIRYCYCYCFVLFCFVLDNFHPYSKSVILSGAVRALAICAVEGPAVAFAIAFYLSSFAAGGGSASVFAFASR